MRAIRVGDDDHNTLEWAEAPTPAIRRDEVLVRVHATAVNRADLLQRRGLYPPPEGASEILGLEAAGIVERVGPDVTGVTVGERVCALLAGGGYAEYVAVPADHVLPLHSEMTFEEAAAIPEVFFTAYLNLFIEAGLQPGERVLLHAGASGVGTAAIQLCRAAGCPVIATASAPKLERLLEMGVAAAVDRKNENFADVVAETTNGLGVEVILDPVAGGYLERNFASMQTGGRLVIIGLLGGFSDDIALNTLLLKRLRVIGSVLRTRSNAEKADITRRFLADVWPGFVDGTYEPVIDSTFSITEAGEAHALLHANETVGKVVLTVE